MRKLITSVLFFGLLFTSCENQKDEGNIDKTSEIESAQRSCNHLKEGVFQYTDPEMGHIEIKRFGNSQIEINTESKIEAHTTIDWISDCEYVLTYKEFKNAPEELNTMIGMKINVEIIEITGDKFKCKVNSDNTDEVMEFRIVD